MTEDEFRCKCGVVVTSEISLKKHQRKDCPIYRLIRVSSISPSISQAQRVRGQFMKKCPYCHKEISNAWFANHKRCCARWGSNLGIKASPESRQTHKRTK